MGVNKVVYGGRTIVDLTDATATPETVLEGYTAYGAKGTRIVGTASATKRREVTISLPLAGWADGQQTVAVSGMTAEATVIVGGGADCEPEYSGYGVACTAQGVGTLTFTAQWEPDRDLTAAAVILTLFPD